MEQIKFWQVVIIGAISSGLTRFVYRFIQIRKMRKEEEQEQNENN